MVVFPTVVKNEIGGLQDTLLEIKNAVAGANLCFRNSEVPIQIRLVHHHEIRLCSNRKSRCRFRATYRKNRWLSR